MKKKFKIIILVIFTFIFLVPVKEHYRDGGTIKYNAILWGVTKHHDMTFDSDGNHGYNTGTTIRILCFDVYSDYPKFVPIQKGV
ncbi:MAG: hypothetical protein K2I80_09510 [Ruminococcus sp.]|nr:hypothetical protein [Ruminococcus sp.]MDE6848240.1 hypothetical protein [Ruminococcus sp.]